MSYLRLIYRSISTERPCSKAFVQILDVSGRRNHARGVTGALTLCGEAYIQVLEGPPDRVEALMQVIGRDPRHHDLRVLGNWAASDRLFSAWGMAHACSRNASERTRDRLIKGDYGLALVGVMFDLANQTTLLI